MLNRSITESLKKVKRQSSDLYLNKKNQKGSMPAATEGQTPRDPIPVADYVFVNQQSNEESQRPEGRNGERSDFKRLQNIPKD